MPLQNPNSPNSVIAKVTAILNQFSTDTPALSLKEIVAGSGVRKSTAHRILQELITADYITPVPNGYAPGLRLFELGVIAQQHLGLGTILDAVLDQFGTKIEETTIFATLRQNEVVYLHVTQPFNPLRYVVTPGERRPPQYGATGLALLTCLTEEQRHKFADVGLKQFTERTQIDPEQWLQRLDEIKRLGYMVEYGEFNEGIGAISIPLPRHRPFSLTVVGPTERIKRKESDIIEALLDIRPRLHKIPLGSFGMM